MSRSWLIPAAVVALALVSLTWVGGDELAVRESFGGTAVALGSGLNLRLPLYHRVYRYDARPVTVDEALDIITEDDASFKLPIRIDARVSGGDLLTFHEGRSGRDTELYIRETILAAVRAAAKTFDADEILLTRASAGMAQLVSADLISRGISDDGLRLEAPRPRVVFNAVTDYLKRGFAASARRLAEASLAAGPKEAMFHAAMAMVLESEGDPEAAENEYLEALFLDPTAMEPMSRLYLMYQERSDAESLGRLERLLLASISKASDSAVHHDWLGQVYMRTGRPDEAEKSFRKAIELSPESSEYYVSLGSLKAQQGNLEEARSAYERALELRSDNPLALFNTGSIHAMQGDLDKALEFFHRAESAGRPTHVLFNALAQAYEEKGQKDRAVEYLRRSLAMRPDQPERRAALERLEAELRKQD